MQVMPTQQAHIIPTRVEERALQGKHREKRLREKNLNARVYNCMPMLLRPERQHPSVNT
jgi:hypothetical protein